MNRYEKQFIVMNRIGETVLQLYQILDSQVFVVRQRRVITVLLCHDNQVARNLTVQKAAPIVS